MWRSKMCGKGDVLATLGHVLATLDLVILGQSQNDHHGVVTAGKPVLLQILLASASAFS